MQLGDVANREQIHPAPCLDTIVDNTEISSLISNSEEAVGETFQTACSLNWLELCENKTKLCSKSLGYNSSQTEPHQRKYKEVTIGKKWAFFLFFGREFNFTAFNKPDAPIQACHSGKELNQNNTGTHSWQTKETINWWNLGTIQEKKN